MVRVFYGEGPKEQPEGVNESRFKILANSSSDLIPKCTPNPKILCTVWSSYEGATPTRKTLGTKVN